MTTTKAFAAIPGVLLGFVLGYAVSTLGIGGCDKSDRAASPAVLSVAGVPLAGWVRESRAVMISYSLGGEKRSGIAFPLSESEAKRLGDALAADLPSRSNEGRRSFTQHFELVFLGGSRLRNLNYDVTSGAAHISCEGYYGMTVRDTSFLHELLPLIHQAETVARRPAIPPGPKPEGGGHAPPDPEIHSR